MSEPIMIGTSVKVSVVFYDETESPFDPGDVVCRIRKPDGTETTYTYGDDDELVRDGTGSYYIWLLPTVSGNWHYRFIGSSPQSVAGEAAFKIERSSFTEP